MITDDMVHAFAVVGTYDEIAAKMKQRLTGCNRFAFDMPTQSAASRVKSYKICTVPINDLHAFRSSC